jgi:hypothetical protein
MALPVPARAVSAAETALADASPPFVTWTVTSNV